MPIIKGAFLAGQRRSSITRPKSRALLPFNSTTEPMKKEPRILTITTGQKSRVSLPFSSKTKPNKYPKKG